MIQKILSGQLNPNQFTGQQTTGPQFSGQQMPMMPMQMDPYGQSIGNLRQLLMGGRLNG